MDHDAPFYSIPEGGEECKENPPETRELRLCIKGDGRNNSKRTHNTQLAFTILNEGRRVLKPRNNYCFAIMDGGEDYDALKNNIGGILDDLNALEGKILTVEKRNWFAFKHTI